MSPKAKPELREFKKWSIPNNRQVVMVNAPIEESDLEMTGVRMRIHLAETRYYRAA